MSGCSWGLRGGSEVLASSSGDVLVQATATGYAGFGSSHNDVSDGIHETATVSVGADARGSGAAVTMAGGLEWFRVPDDDNRHWGYHIGAEGGARFRGENLHVLEVVATVRGGPLFRIGARNAYGVPLLTLGFDLLLNVAGVTSGAPENASGAVGFALTIGFIKVRPFHL